MIQGVKVINHESKAFDFLLNDTMNSGIYIMNIEGLGYPSSTISTSSIFNYDVSSYEGTTKQPRNIVITFGISNYGYYTVEQARRFIYEMFPHDVNLYMEFKTDDVNYHITGYVENVTPTIFEQKESIQVSIICPNPYFYSGGKEEKSSSDMGNNFEFTEWFEQLEEKNGIWSLHKKDVSHIIDLEDSSCFVAFHSRINDPTGLEIKIGSKSNESFNKVVLKTDDTTIIIDPNPIPYNTVSGGDHNNFFSSANLVIVNDYDDQNVYKEDVDTGKRESILGDIIIDGDIPSIRAGYNMIKASVVGVVEKELPSSTIRYYPIEGFHVSGVTNPYIDVIKTLNQFQNEAWILNFRTNCYKIEVDVFHDLNNVGRNEYIGHIRITTDDPNLPERVDSDPMISIPPDVDSSGNVAALTPYYKIKKDYKYVGIFMERYNEKQGYANEFEENGFFYKISLQVQASTYSEDPNTFYSADLLYNKWNYKDSYHESSYRWLNVEIVDRAKTDMLQRMYSQLYQPTRVMEGDKLYGPITFEYSYFYKVNNPLNKPIYQYEYADIKNSKMAISYDEMIDAL